MQLCVFRAYDIIKSGDASTFVVIMAAVVPLCTEGPVAPFVLNYGGILCAMSVSEVSGPDPAR